MIVPHVFEWLTAALVLAVLWVLCSIPLALWLGPRLRDLSESYPEESAQ